MLGEGRGRCVILITRPRSDGLLSPMRFGIFELSRGGNPYQSETNLNQKTPETHLPGFSHFSQLTRFSHTLTVEVHNSRGFVSSRLLRWYPRRGELRPHGSGNWVPLSARRRIFAGAAWPVRRYIFTLSDDRQPVAASPGHRAFPASSNRGRGEKRVLLWRPVAKGCAGKNGGLLPISALPNPFKISVSSKENWPAVPFFAPVRLSPRAVSG